jgi:hypothetical protein
VASSRRRADPGALWLLKRTPMGQGGAGPLRSVAGLLPLSTGSQRLVTVEVGIGERAPAGWCWASRRSIIHAAHDGPRRRRPAQSGQSRQATRSPSLTRCAVDRGHDR